jgi:hypothetical protein
MAQMIGPGLHIRELGHRALQIVSPKTERLVSLRPWMSQDGTAADRQFGYPEGLTGKLLPIGSTISDFIFLLRNSYSCCGSDVHSLFNSQEKLGSL